MTRFRLPRPALIAIAMSAALGLTGCGSEDAASAGAVSSEPVAAVPPPEGQQWSNVVSTTEQGGYLMGNPDAPIKLVEYASLTCSHCAEFAETAMEPLRENYVNSGRVSFELRNFVRDPIDITGAMLTRCGTPESYFPLTEQFLANQDQVFGDLQQAGEARIQQAIAAPDDQRYVQIAEAANLIDFFSARGIAREQALSCLRQAETATTLANNTESQAESYDLTGTPSFLLNNRRIDAISWPDVEAALQQAGAR